MTDTTNSLTTNQSSGITLKTPGVGASSQSKNDAQYPYSSQDGEAADPDAGASVEAFVYTHRAPSLASPRAWVGAQGEAIPEENMVLDLVTGTTSAQTESTRQGLKTNKQKLDAQNDKAEKDIAKRLHDFKRMMSKAGAMKGLNLFIKIAVPIAAAAIAVGTLGSGAPLAAGLIAYSVAASVVKDAQGTNLQLGDLAETGIREGLTATNDAVGGGLSKEDVAGAAMIATGVIGLAASVFCPEILMANPDLASKATQGIVQNFASKEDAMIAGTVSGAVAGLAAGGKVMNNTAARMAARDAARNAGGAGAGAAEGNAAGAAADGAADAGSAADEVAVSSLQRLQPLITRMSNNLGGGMQVSNAGVEGGQAGLQFEQARAELDSKLHEADATRNKILAEAAQDQSGRLGSEMAAILQRFQELTELTMDIRRKKHEGAMQVAGGQTAPAA